MDQANGNAALYFIDRHLREGLSDKVAFVEGVSGRQLTYGELAQSTSCLADLYRRHGLREDDRAATIVLDTVDFPIIFWGSLKAGIIPIPLNTLLSADYFEIILKDSRARALFVSSELLPVVEPLFQKLPHLQRVFVVGGNSSAYPSFEQELAASTPSPVVEVSPYQGAFWLYSSGSTGKPKGVKHVHANLRATSDTFGRQVLGITKDDVVLSAAKMFFAYGLGNAMTFPLSVGATTALYPLRPTPEGMFELIRKLKPTIFCGVPTLYGAMLAHAADVASKGLHPLRCCVSAGEALPAEVGNAWKRLTGVDIIDGVGSTEMLHIFLSNAPKNIVYGTSGIAVPGYNLRLVNEQDGDVETGEVGELLVEGPSAAEGYWNRLDATRNTFVGRWTRTGDRYVRRDDGRFVFCGRSDDMFKVSGIWVSPFEVEQALCTHPSVLEAAVVAAKDGADLEKPKAFVVLKENGRCDTIVEQLKAHVKSQVGAWKYPRWIEIVDDLPKTATGKIQRFKLR